MNVDSYLSDIDINSNSFDSLSDYIWDNPELGYKEFKASSAIKQVLRDNGFKLEENLGNIPTAFSGTFGTGKPIIGILGEFDALSGMGQKANSTNYDPDHNENGHACGHNQLGVGSLAACFAVKKYLEEAKVSGTVIYLGCPAEETGSGKTFMVREGVFDNLDVALYWHPATENYVRPYRNLANSIIVFDFKGISAHAGSSAYLGRSALDAAELMNVGVQFLREHIIPEARIHYSFLDTGGISPNVVQASSKLKYMIRAPRMEDVRVITDRVINIAKGAALMTETEVTWQEKCGASSLILNSVLMETLQNVLETLPPPVPDTDDLRYGRAMLADGMANMSNIDIKNPYHTDIKALDRTEPLKYTSNDLGDVSWVCPIVQLYTASQLFGTPNHTWAVTTQGKSSMGHKMMRYAGKVLAKTAVTLIENPEIIEKSKEEHRKRIGTSSYICPIPEGMEFFSL